jgi:aryl-alcohol dehydrogenase-like predicted oxidoreductase
MSNQPAAVERVTLGSSDIKISPIGIGTWAWGDRIVWGYSKEQDAELKNSFQTTIDAGINFFDTAELYGFGQSEKLLGQFMQTTQQPLIIATKFMPLPWRFTKGQLLSALRGSLRRLGMARVDLYQIHWPSPLVPLERWMDGLADAVDAGLTRTVGVSNYSLDEMRRAHAALMKRGVALASNQVEYSLLVRDPERTGILKACQELGITLIAYSPIAMGMLTGKYTPENPPKGARARMYTREYLAKIQPLIGLLREIGQAHGGKTPSQVSLNWLICKGTVPIPGVKNVRQLQDNLGALGWRLTDDEVAALESAADRANR